MRREPSLTFRGALRILGRTETPLIDKLDVILGGVILAAGAGAAIATVGGGAVAGAALLAPAWQWVDQKNEAGGVLRKLVARFGPTINGVSGLERRRLVGAAHSTIVVAAYFDVFHEAVEAAGFGGFMFTESEKQAAARPDTRRNYGSLAEWLYSAEIPAPSATCGFEENLAGVTAWLQRLDDSNFDLLRSLGLEQVFDDALLSSCAQAAERYRTYYVDLAANVREFEIWAELDEHAATRAAVNRSFERIADILTSRGVGDVHTPESALIIHRANLGRLNDRIVSAALPWPTSTVPFPTIEQLFVAPGFRITSYSDETRASNEGWWSQLPVEDDIVGRLAAHILSPAATRAPLLLLGHPGAGKSMLTKVLAAHLPAAEYTAINVPLRAVIAHAQIHEQIQQALNSMTHERVRWADLTDETADRVRVVFLDGLDELLQASDRDLTGYLHDVLRFQELEADQDRPVAVVVTSRTVVADRVDIPAGTAIVKLAEFDDDRIDDWLTRWNGATGGQTAHQLSRAEALRQPHLARQPLLLMLLALYAGSPGASELVASSSTAALYDHLFLRFAGREAAKTAGERAQDDDTTAAVETSIDRLSIAALAMFNRGQQQVGEAELGKDLEALGMNAGNRRLKEAGQRLLAEFFFVHADEATVIGGQQLERSYEFLHATFGEYLVAKKILEVLRDVADAAYGSKRRSRVPDDDLLQALLGHQALAGSQPIVRFAGEIFATVPEEERSDIVAAVDFLISQWRSRRPSDRFREYVPIPFDQLRCGAAYSANLVILRLALAAETGIAIPPDWTSLVTLWRAGLDPDAWLATLGAISLDRQCSKLVAAPPSHGQILSEYDYARLIGNKETAQYLGVGASTVNNIDGLFDEELDWLDHMQSALLPAIFLGTSELSKRAFVPPPPGTAANEVDAVARSLERLLRTRSVDLAGERVEQAISLLLKLSPEPDPAALMVAIYAHPDLLLSVPDLRNASLYQDAPAAVLMMYASQRSSRASDANHPWNRLFERLAAESGFRPDENFSLPGIIAIKDLLDKVISRKDEEIPKGGTRRNRPDTAR